MFLPSWRDCTCREPGNASERQLFVQQPHAAPCTQVIVRASPIGIDRDMNRYWWFQTDSGSLYIERPPSIGPAVEMEGAGASGVGGAQPMDTTPAGASPAGATPAGETLSVAGATLAGSGPEKMDVDSPEQGAAAPPKPKEEEKEFEWGLAARLVGREESSVTSEWARYSTPEQLDELLVRSPAIPARVFSRMRVGFTVGSLTVLAPPA